MTRCNWRGCENEADPRWWMHGIDGKAAPACDAHTELPCLTTDESECKCCPWNGVKPKEPRR